MPTGIYPRPPLGERFWKRVQKTSQCWLWTGARARNGCGQIRYRRKLYLAHRVSYELAYVPIPEGKDIDHLCRVRHCVNPSHLEVVDRRTNVLRGVSSPADNARRTHCIRGHELSGTNLVPGRRSRRCRACDELRNARERLKRAARRKPRKIVERTCTFRGNRFPMRSCLLKDPTRGRFCSLRCSGKARSAAERQRRVDAAQAASV